MSTLAPPQRSGSIRRTPSDLSRELASQNLPDPETITRGERREEASRKREEVTGKLASMEGEEPEGAYCVLFGRATDLAGFRAARATSRIVLPVHGFLGGLQSVKAG